VTERWRTHPRAPQRDGNSLQAIVRQAEDALDHRTSLQDSLGQSGQRLAQLRGEMRALIGSAHLCDKGVSAQADEAAGAGEEALLAEARDASETARYTRRPTPSSSSAARRLPGRERGRWRPRAR
jgi:hypothetical protein